MNAHVEESICPEAVLGSVLEYESPMQGGLSWYLEMELECIKKKHGFEIIVLAGDHLRSLANQQDKQTTNELYFIQIDPTHTLYFPGWVRERAKQTYNRQL